MLLSDEQISFCNEDHFGINKQFLRWLKKSKDIGHSRCQQLIPILFYGFFFLKQVNLEEWADMRCPLSKNRGIRTIQPYSE